MSQANLFQHQTYRPTRPTSPHFPVKVDGCHYTGDPEFRRRMQAVGAAYRRAGVARIYLVHGALLSFEAVGALGELARAFPAASRAVRRVIARIVDSLTGEGGSFTEEYARRFEAAIREPGQPPIPVELFHWSSENHHIGRADGAVRLIDELASLQLPQGSRVLLWGHSHAGNVFALLTQLLAQDGEAAEQFFQAAEVYYQWPLLRLIDIPIWHRARRLLGRQATRPALDGVSLDMVTFGTPIRYGWNAGGYGKLLHFIHRRPTPGMPHYRAAFPPTVDDVLSAAEGDYVQQLGIAGTDVVPSVLQWRARVANRRLGRLFHDRCPQSGLLERFQAGAIVPDAGTTLLVDYGMPKCGIAEHHAGHAVYTYKTWMLFHAEEVARRFYSGVHP